MSIIKQICSLLVCASCRDSIAAFQRLVPLTSVESNSAWLVLAHNFVNAKVGKPRFSGQRADLDDEDFYFHLTMTLCFFADHHPAAKLQCLFRLLHALLSRQAPWLAGGLQDCSLDTLLIGYNNVYPSSALPPNVVKWVIDASRKGTR